MTNLTVELDAPPTTTFKRRSEFGAFWDAFASDKAALAGGAVILAVILAGVLAPLLATFEPNVASGARLAPVGSPGNVLGTDGQGRDVLSRLMWGARVSLPIAILPVVFAAVIGIALGTLASYFGGIVDALIMRILDVLFAFPIILLAIAIAVAVGPGMMNVMLAIGIVLIPYTTRLVHVSVQTLKHRLFVETSRSSGARAWQILGHDIIPNALPPVIVYASTQVGFLVIFAAGLSFLGLGVEPPTSDWGIMTADGTQFLTVAPHVSLIPGVVITIVALSFNVIGDGLRDALDPALRR